LVKTSRIKKNATKFSEQWLHSDAKNAAGMEGVIRSVKSGSVLRRKALRAVGCVERLRTAKYWSSFVTVH